MEKTLQKYIDEFEAAIKCYEEWIAAVNNAAAECRICADGNWSDASGKCPEDKPPEPEKCSDSCYCGLYSNRPKCGLVDCEQLCVKEGYGCPDNKEVVNEGCEVKCFGGQIRNIEGKCECPPGQVLNAQQQCVPSKPGFWEKWKNKLSCECYKHCIIPYIVGSLLLAVIPIAYIIFSLPGNIFLGIILSFALALLFGAGGAEIGNGLCTLRCSEACESEGYIINSNH